MSESMYSQAAKELAQGGASGQPRSRRRSCGSARPCSGRGAAGQDQAADRDGGVAHVTQCPCWIKGHPMAALRHGAPPEELMEAIWVAAEMRAGGAYAHSARALETIDPASDRKGH
jgi:AhpD family alkylhydroperoxidase